MDLEILRRTPLFANLDDAAFALLTDDIQEIDLSRNAVLFYEGDQDDQLFAVLSVRSSWAAPPLTAARTWSRLWVPVMFSARWLSSTPHPVRPTLSLFLRPVLQARAAARSHYLRSGH